MDSSSSSSAPRCLVQAPPLELGSRNPGPRPSHNPSVDDRVALLLSAAQDGYVPKIRKLVERLEEHAGMSVAEAVAGVPWTKGHGPLHRAASAGRLKACKFLIEELKLDVSAAGTDGATPLDFAVHSSGSLAVVKLLLDHKADPDRVGSYGSAPLHTAVIRGTYEIAEESLSIGAWVDREWKYISPLYIAAQYGNTRMMELLLRHKPHLNCFLHTPLKAAIFTRSLKGMELLIKAGADVNSGLPETPLIAAAAAGLTDFVKCLLEAGADANIPDANGRIAVEIAAIQGWQECVEVLFPATARLDRVADWSIDGITQHAKLMCSEPQDPVLYEDDGSDYEEEGDATFYRRDYCHALTLYTIGHKVKALEDATTYKDMKPDSSKSCYAQKSALFLVEEYDDEACKALLSDLNLDSVRELLSDLNLDPGGEPSDKAFGEGPSVNEGC